MFTPDEVRQNPTHFSFSVGTGYKHVGPLKIPSTPRGPASNCEPDVPSEEGSWHRLIPFNQPENHYIRAMWHPGKRTWTPPLEMQGRRVAFTSQYLAAHGWLYGEAE